MRQSSHFWERAHQCRRLAGTLTALRDIESLMAMAEEFDAKAKAMEATDPVAEPPTADPASSSVGENFLRLTKTAI